MLCVCVCVSRLCVCVCRTHSSRLCAIFVYGIHIYCACVIHNNNNGIIYNTSARISINKTAMHRTQHQPKHNTIVCTIITLSIQVGAASARTRQKRTRRLAWAHFAPRHPTRRRRRRVYACVACVARIVRKAPQSSATRVCVCVWGTVLQCQGRHIECVCLCMRVHVWMCLAGRIIPHTLNTPPPGAFLQARCTPSSHVRQPRLFTHSPPPVRSHSLRVLCLLISETRARACTAHATLCYTYHIEFEWMQAPPQRVAGIVLCARPHTKPQHSTLYRHTHTQHTHKHAPHRFT